MEGGRDGGREREREERKEICKDGSEAASMGDSTERRKLSEPYTYIHKQNTHTHISVQTIRCKQTHTYVHTHRDA